MKTLCLSLLAAVVLAVATGMAERANSPSTDRQGTLRARVIATGIPGAGAVSEVGDSLRGAPFATTPPWRRTHNREKCWMRNACWWRQRRISAPSACDARTRFALPTRARHFSSTVWGSEHFLRQTAIMRTRQNSTLFGRAATDGAALAWRICTNIWLSHIPRRGAPSRTLQRPRVPSCLSLRRACSRGRWVKLSRSGSVEDLERGSG